MKFSKNSIKSSLFFVLMVFANPVDVRSQSRIVYKNDSLRIMNCGMETIAINSGKSPNNDNSTLLQLPFASIAFNDVRFDTSYFGVINSSKVNSNVNFR